MILLNDYLTEEESKQLYMIGSGNEYPAAETLFECDETRAALREELRHARELDAANPCRYSPETVTDHIRNQAERMIDESIDLITKEYLRNSDAREPFVHWLRNVFTLEMQDCDYWEIAVYLIKALDRSEQDEKE